MTFPHFRFVVYFVQHGLTVITPLVLVIVLFRLLEIPLAAFAAARHQGAVTTELPARAAAA